MWLQTLTDCNGNAQSPAAANRLISFSVFFVSFLPPCCHPQHSTPSVFSFSSLVSCLACSYFSSAWSGDWKPPKVRRDCPSQKQPAQQPCKSNWEKTLLKLEQILKKGLVHPACLFALLFTAAVSMLFPERPLALCVLGLECLRPPAFTWHHWFSQHLRDQHVYICEMYPWISNT